MLPDVVGKLTVLRSRKLCPYYGCSEYRFINEGI